MKVLVAEDEAKIRNFIDKGLKAEGFNVDSVGNGEDALILANQEPYDVILLDIMMPERDGLSILKNLRSNKINVPVILVTARGELDDRLEGLNLGADDYLPKPFHIDELIARIRAVCRRTTGAQMNLQTIGDLVINHATREVKRADHEIEFTQREFSLLELLSRSPGRVYTRMQILEYVWNYDFDPNTNLVDVYIKRVRKKLDEFGDPLIETIRGVGYRFKKPD
ncbi:MAG: response regulator transcription factor [Opitutales bacterium]|nr:response regulator transcription factor [Opitutales bacterium]